MDKIKDIFKDFKDLGVDITDKDGGFLPIHKVLNNLSMKWGSLKVEKKNKISDSVAK